MMNRKHTPKRANRIVGPLLSLATTFLVSVTSFAIADTSHRFHIPAQPLAKALVEFAQQSNTDVIAPAHLVTGKKAPEISGDMMALDALKLLLQGSGLQFSEEGGEITIHGSQESSARGIRIGADGKTSSASNYILEEIVVTAQKREQRLIDVPMSVFAQTGEELNASGVTDLQSLSLAVPGMFVDESGSRFRRISIRGVGNFNGSSSLVGIYLDEAAVASMQSDQIDLRVLDIERVEVLKGPQPTLYGEGSVGGVIRYITKDPILDRFEGQLSADTSFSQDGEASHDLRSVVNIPLIDDRLGLRIAGQYINSGGWIDQPARSLSDINGYELSNIRTKLLWRPIDNLEVEGTAVIHRNDGGAQNVGEDKNGNYRQSFDDNSTPSAEDNYEFYSLLVDYDFGGISLISSTSYLDSHRSVTNFGNQCCFPTGNPNQYWNILYRENSSSAEILTQEVRVSTNGDGPLNGTFGLFYRDAEMVPFEITDFIFGVPGGTLGVDIFSFNLFGEGRSRSWALFGEASYKIVDNVEIGAGLRYFEDDRRQRSAASGPFQKATFDSWNPRLFISYGLTEDIRLYANVAKGFRSGGFNAVGQPPFEPESVWSYEVGSKFSALDGRLNAELSLFNSIYDDYQIVGVDPNLFINITANAGKARIRGIDASVVFLTTEDLELGVTGNYTDAEFTEINVLSSSHAVGDPLNVAPRYGFSLWGYYSFAWPDSRPGFIRVDYSQQGRSYYRNRTFGPGYADTSDIIGMLNTRVGWNHESWSAEVYATNLLNERGFLSALDIELGAPRPRPRTIGMKIGVHF